MLAPGNRLTLIDAMRPPAGMQFDQAVAVTFTLDLRALLAAPAAFAMAAPSQDADAAKDHTTEPVELLHAIRSHAHKLTVFSQAGEISLPPSRRVFSFLESVVVPVTAPRGGVVHPKIWVLRYKTVGPAPAFQLRVLCASRNLTFDTSWDTVLRLDQTSSTAGVQIDGCADLFEGLLDQTLGETAPSHVARVELLAGELRTAKFAAPEGVAALSFHVLGFSANEPTPFPNKSDRSLVISPFVSDDFFRRVLPKGVDELVSRPETMDQLDPVSLGKVGQLLAFDDGSGVEGDDDSKRSDQDPGRSLVGLHAKLFMFEHGNEALVFCGSANATGAAFGSNVEVLVELRGLKSRLGIDRMLEVTSDEIGMRQLFLPYNPADDDGTDEETAANRVDQVRRTIGRLTVSGTVEPSGQDWAITYRTAEIVDAPDGVSVSCWPLSTAGNRRWVPSGEPLQARFETTLEALSGFLAWEVVDQEADLESRFVAPVELSGVPEDRDAALMRSLIGNAERFFRYLLAILGDDPTSMDAHSLSDAFATTSITGHVAGLPVLEKLVKSMRRDPSKLLGLDALVRSLARDDALPEGFADLWELVQGLANREATRDER